MCVYLYELQKYHMGSDQIHIEKILDKLAAGKISLSEKKELRTYIQSTFKNEKLDDLMRLHWDRVDSRVEDGDKAILTEVRAKVLTAIEGDRRSTKSGRHSSIERWRSYLTRAAAILFIPLLVYSGYLVSTLYKQKAVVQEQLVMQEIFASPGSRVHFTLPDSTEVWLNSASKLEFPVTFSNQETRRVKLYGQGYFKVSPDKTHPFIVETSDINIKVLGTSFDVASYADDVNLVSTLEEGSIAILNSSGKEVARLNPGEQANLNKDTREMSIEEVDTEITTSWKDGRLLFKNAPLVDVVKQLERWYNCEIFLAPELRKSDFQYTATIQDETLGEVLQMIEISTSVNSSIKNREVRIWAK